MVGNSLRSDIVPVVALGGRAVHIPYEVTWHHEHVPDDSLPKRRLAPPGHDRRAEPAARLARAAD